MTDMKTIDLVALNAATRYPSILNIHELKNGELTERIDASIQHADPGTTLFVTEKIDGANGRIIFVPTQNGWTWVIGSRKELLAERGQRIYRNADYIVTTLTPYAETMMKHVAETYPRTSIIVYFMESYGRVQQWQNYGNGKTSGVALFDVAEIPLEIIQDRSPHEDDQRVEERLSAWRDDNNQAWRNVTGDGSTPTLSMIRKEGIIPMVPYLGTITVGELLEHKTLQDMSNWMDNMLSIEVNGTRVVATHAHLLNPDIREAITAKSAIRRIPEGLVVRDNSREIIVKIRRTNYIRALKGKTK